MTKALRALLLIVGALGVCAAVSGVQRVRISSSDGILVFHFSSASMRFVVGVFGLLLFALAASGGSVRLWYAGAAVFLLAAAGLVFQGIVAAATSADAFTRVWGAVSQILVASIVIILFIRWWLPKRKNSNRGQS